MTLALYIFSYLSIFFTLLPHSRNKHWVVRGQMNFRAIYLVLNLVFALLLICTQAYTLLMLSTLLLLLYCVGVCIYTVGPYTIFGKKNLYAPKVLDVDRQLKLLIYNVYQYNEEYDKLIDLIEAQNPDIILLLETSHKWDSELSKLKNKYPHIIKDIKDDTYGILYMSKIKFSEGETNYLVKDDIPSIEAYYQKLNHNIRVIGVHPEPPIPGEVTTSKPKDLELSRAAKHLAAQTSDELQIVIGDLNDVAWSKASRKFVEVSQLADPRLGRGFYSTFPTYSPIKFPLDHIYCSPQFGLVAFKILDDIGSDHYPVSITLQIPE